MSKYISIINGGGGGGPEVGFDIADSGVEGEETAV
jgi:hypothetical protein